ncbi:MAG: hypothetical protein EBX52_04640 [Proteobacteria bacterium]|nr:hypothetical protein [Pseudomonadota bacterium]
MNLHFLFALCSLIPALSFATSFYLRPMEEVVAGTPNIVRGTVRSVHVEEQADPNGGRALFTLAEVEVKEVLKGPIQDSKIEVRRAGGEKNGTHLEIPGSPEFAENEETVLFLGNPRSDRSYEVRDMALGKFGIDLKNGKEVLTGGLLAYSHETENEEHAEYGAKQPPRDWSIRDLKALIQSQGGSPQAPVANPTPGPSSSSPANPSTASQSPPSAPATAPSAAATPVASMNPSDPESSEHGLSGRALAGLLAGVAGLVLGGVVLYRKKN